MTLIKKIFVLLTFLIINSCASKSEEIEEIQRDENGVVICTNTAVSISAGDNIVIPHATNPVVWKGTYSDTSVKINFTIPVSDNGESEKYIFIFDKTGYCPKIERAYKFYDGNEDDVSAITEIDILEFYIKDWKVDEKFSGLIYYKDPHNKQFFSRKFWVEFTEENREVENTNYSFFSDCFGDELPIDLDMNNDGIVDYKMIAEENRNIGNKPQFNTYIIKLISTNQNKNLILSPINNQSPFTVIFETPFTSENKTQYISGVKNALDVFYEFDTPYESYNYFLNNNLTNKKTLSNNKDDYYIIRMNLDDKNYYGWIKFKFNAAECDVAILETFLNPIETKHIYLE